MGWRYEAELHPSMLCFRLCAAVGQISAAGAGPDLPYLLIVCENHSLHERMDLEFFCFHSCIVPLCTTSPMASCCSSSLQGFVSYPQLPGGRSHPGGDQPPSRAASASLSLLNPFWRGASIHNDVNECFPAVASAHGCPVKGSVGSKQR